MALAGTIKRLSLFNFLTDADLLSTFAIIYYAQIAGSYVAATSIFSISMISQAMFEVPTGMFSDHIGRRKTMIAGTISVLLAATAVAMSKNYGMLVVGAVLEGLGRAFYSGNNTAYLHDLLKAHRQENEYNEFLGKTSALFQVGAAVSAIIAGLIATLSFRTLAWMAVGLHLLQLAVAWKFEDVPAKANGNVFKDLKTAIHLFVSNPKLRLLSAASMIGYALGEPAYQFRSAFIQTLWPVWAIGIARFLSSIGAAISFYLSGRLIKRFSAIKILLFQNLYSRAVNMGSLMFTTPLSPLFMSSTSLLHGANEVAETALMQKEFSDDQRATMGSLNSLGGSLLFAIVAVILGYLADGLNPAKALLLLQIASFIVLGLNLKLWFKIKNDA